MGSVETGGQSVILGAVQRILCLNFCPPKFPVSWIPRSRRGEEASPSHSRSFLAVGHIIQYRCLPSPPLFNSLDATATTATTRSERDHRFIAESTRVRGSSRTRLLRSSICYINVVVLLLLPAGRGGWVRYRAASSALGSWFYKVRKRQPTEQAASPPVAVNSTRLTRDANAEAKQPARLIKLIVAASRSFASGGFCLLASSAIRGSERGSEGLPC